MFFFYYFTGVGGVLVGHPFDTVKVHLQTQSFTNPVYKGTFHCLKTIIAKDSFRGLYRGVTSPMVKFMLMSFSIITI
jgi:solute carrier family 25 (mitochondrial carnitine/acylcarnitine transporter), member 20/29